jgi:hypothetical protein
MPTLERISAMRIEALAVTVAAPHINAMPFSGCLTRVGTASDRAPNGTNGKRILLQRAAAESALPSLRHMAVNLSKDGRLSGHDVSNAIGVVTEAHISGDALNVSGIIHCNDHPKEALAIQVNKADLGMSFEASGVVIDGSLDDDVLKIKSLCFTGCSILFRNEAAYAGTSIAASAERETVPVHPVLLRALDRAGIQKCGDGDRLTAEQLQKLMVGDVATRISVKQLVAEAGLWPRPFGG